LASPKQSASTLSQPPLPLSFPQQSQPMPRMATLPPTPVHVSSSSSSSNTSAALLLRSMHQAAPVPHLPRPAPPTVQATLQYQRTNVAVQP
jgi:hypothetical protein